MGWVVDMTERIACNMLKGGITRKRMVCIEKDVRRHRDKLRPEEDSTKIRQV
jgi:hypothetical protein